MTIALTFHRPTGSSAPAMAEFFIERQSLSKATTREDLLAAGFDGDEIDAHANKARSTAAKRMVRDAAVTQRREV
ncbi:MAG: hypothetical protein GY798_26330 [Hyphomicrobiales bacterium]|nr:hypothetical protein [Hyphomicrobiales bacterium]